MINEMTGSPQIISLYPLPSKYVWDIINISDFGENSVLTALYQANLLGYSPICRVGFT